MKCPKCGFMNPESALMCNCGYNFSTQRFYESYKDMRIRDFFFNSWHTFGVNWLTFLGVAAIPTALLFALLLAAGPALGEETAPVTIAVVVLLIVSEIVVGILSTIALTMAAHKTSDGQAIGIWESYSLSWGLFWRYIWTTILYFLIVLGGLFLFIIPGIIWAVRYVFAPYIVIVEGLGGRAALSRSKALTRGRLFATFLFELGFGLLFIIIFLVPCILLVLLIGQFLGLPLLAAAIDQFSDFVTASLFVIFNVLLFKSRRILATNEEALQKADEGETAHGGLEARPRVRDLYAQARLNRALGKHADAEHLYRQALAILETEFGADHPEVAMACDTMADFFRKTGKEDEAERLEVRAQEIRSKR